jgi:hypothetical protein
MEKELDIVDLGTKHGYAIGKNRLRYLTLRLYLPGKLSSNLLK